MKKLLKSFLEENIATDYSNEKFDYNFNDNVPLIFSILNLKSFLAYIILYSIIIIGL